MEIQPEGIYADGAKIAAVGLTLALGAAIYGVFELGHPSTVSAKKKAAAAEAALVDQAPFRTAQQLAQMATRRKNRNWPRTP